ncbi:MAG: hypothetical protein ACKE5M_05855 [Methylophilaceae bacterium]
MSSLTKHLVTLSLTIIVFITPSIGFSEVTCAHDVLGLTLGLTKEVTKKRMLEQGFREVPVRHNTSMHFTNKVPWPPEGIVLNREQLRLASILQDPRRKKMLEKQAKTDASLKKRMANLPPIPEKGNADVIDVRIVLGKTPGKKGSNNDAAPIIQVLAEYRFPTDVNGRAVIYAPSHQKTNQTKWQKYCSDVDISNLRDHRFMEKNDTQVRVCQNNPGASGHPIQISLQATPTAGKRGCHYMYRAGPLTSSEHIK